NRGKQFSCLIAQNCPFFEITSSNCHFLSTQILTKCYTTTHIACLHPSLLFRAPPNLPHTTGKASPLSKPVNNFQSFQSVIRTDQSSKISIRRHVCFAFLLLLHKGFEPFFNLRNYTKSFLMNKVQSTWKLNRHLLRKKWWYFKWEANKIKKAKLKVCSFPPFQFSQPFSRYFSIML
ncbi:hypothetical protein PanWU01x14_340900, partial [Parasponia andersonii]